MAPHIVLNELGMKYEAIQVDMKTKKAGGNDFNQLNHKGYVPALMLDNGEMLTEGAVIMQYLADQKPEAGLIPKAGTWERYRAMEWLNFIATEIHKGFSPLWSIERAVKDKGAQTELKSFNTGALEKRLNFLSENLKGKTFLMGNQFTVCDAYLFTLLSWTKWLKMDLSKWPDLMGYVERVQNRPAVAQTLKAEEKFHH